MNAPKCRLCGDDLTQTFVDLGTSPPCESYLDADQLDRGETFYPLHVRICSSCLLVQLPAYLAGEDIFSHYAYFSSYSESWVAHAKRYVDAAVARLDLDETSLVVEVASNDGYLLQHVRDLGIRCLGIEPAANIAEVARAKGIDTVCEFLGEATGTEVSAAHGKADLVAANNVFAHVPDIVDFARGLRALLKDDGTLTIEIPHLLRLIEDRLYDTIYHEHYSYLSLITTQRVLAEAGLTVVDVEELTTHGGSLRTWSMPTESAPEPSARVAKVLADERRAGLDTVEGHAGFAQVVSAARDDLVDFLIQARREGATVAGYGAPGKGNTLLNHAGVREDLLAYTVDRSTFKQGMFLPGTHIPIHAPEKLAETKPDYILILPWNLREEITAQLAYTREWGARLLVPLPRLEVY
ncbi:methyltransferase domain-containing protein [Nocardioides sp. MAH-18]|uniref:Methyltransferase domain-containing protein n=1 Tax=Nocardioides agri TaxID=2682843 RepID=A0A6L6XPB3_9ACTN|nr:MULTISPECIES: class I SAM-dependent methyltransferase [unclassified Nocardioides]MBA2954248.1 class I SAM-dependent methyltransferase [Nocardioides sp. CGMCC 1.13656]MVQ49109.1 methyltransferase domain-containing protein [Nocardioides sp. MAH-18]